MPHPILGAGHPVVNTKNPCLCGADIMVDLVDVGDEMIRLETPKRRACEVEGSNPAQTGHDPEGGGWIRGGDSLGAWVGGWDMAPKGRGQAGPGGALRRGHIMAGEQGREAGHIWQTERWRPVWDTVGVRCQVDASLGSERWHHQ